MRCSAPNEVHVVKTPRCSAPNKVHVVKNTDIIMAAHKMNMLRVWPAFVAKCFWALCFTQHLVPHSAGHPYTEHFTQWATCFFQHYPSFDSRCCQNLSVSHLSQVLLMENVAFSLCVCVGLGGGVVFAQLFLFVLVLVRSRSFCSVWLFVLVRFSVGFVLVVCACVVLGGGGVHSHCLAFFVVFARLSAF